MSYGMLSINMVGKAIIKVHNVQMRGGREARLRVSIINQLPSSTASTWGLYGSRKSGNRSYILFTPLSQTAE